VASHMNPAPADGFGLQIVSPHGGPTGMDFV
jgi:hypothetical protein